MLSISVRITTTSLELLRVLTVSSVVDLQIYPDSLFKLAMVIGLLFVRRARRRLDLPKTEFRAWDFVVYFNILVMIFLVVMPWYPPAKGRNGGDVSFWYGTYIVVGIAM